MFVFPRTREPIIGDYSEQELTDLVAPFYYLTARDALEGPFEARVRLSRADVIPDDLASIIDFSEQQVAFARQLFVEHGERWIGRLLAGDAGTGRPDDELAAFLLDLAKKGLIEFCSQESGGTRS